MPTAVFDMLGTFFSLESLRPRLTALGAPESALDMWFAESQRDFFAISYAGAYVPFADVLAAALPRTLAELARGSQEPARLRGVLEGLRLLEPSPGAAEACALLQEAGWTLIALTNGAEASTRALLERAGLKGVFEAVLSTDALRLSKPHPDVYAMARAVSRGETWMVAAHAWDIHGARREGMATAWVSLKERRWLGVLPEPDLRGDNLADVARKMVATARTGMEPTAPPFMPLG